VQLAAALTVTDLASEASAAPPALVRATVAVGVSERAAGAVGALTGSLWVRRVLSATSGVVMCAIVAAGLGAAGRAPVGDPLPIPTEKPVAEPQVVADARGDPLPTGASARLGSTRWRHEGGARSLSLSPDGKMLAVLSSVDGAITFFDTLTGKVIHRVDRDEGLVPAPGSIAFSPDGKFFACRFEGGTVRLWDARTKKLVRTLGPLERRRAEGGHRSPICFSPDGTRLAVSTPGAVVTIWEVATGKSTAALVGHNHDNPPLAFSPDGKVVFLGAVDPGVQLWDANTGKFLRGLDTGAFSLAVSPDGKFVASGGRDRIVVSVVETGKEHLRLEAKKMGAVLDLGFTPDGKTLVSGAEDANVRVWDLATKKERFVLDSRGWISQSMALSADGKTVAAGTVYNVVRAWDVATGRELSARADGHDAPIRTVSFSPDGRTLVTGGENHQIRLWDGGTGRFVQQLKGHSANQLAFSPDGRLLASAWEWNKRARVRDLERGIELYELAHDSADQVPSVAFTRDGKHVLTVSWRWNGEKPLPDTPHTPRCTGVLRTWDAATGKIVGDATLPDIQYTVLALSPNGGLAAVGGSGAAPLWICDLNRGRQRRLSQEPWDDVKALAFSPDGRMLATGGIDRENVVTNAGVHRRVQLWEVSTGRKIMTLSGHERTVTATAFAPGGHILVTADGGDNFSSPRPGPQTIRFWDVVTGNELARFGGHGSDVTSLAFSPDGKELVVGLHNGTALVWKTPAAVKRPVKIGRKLGPRELAALWGDLAGGDAAVAHEAIRILAASPEQSVPFLAGVLRPAEKIDVTKSRQRIADLGSDEFAVRESASKELAEWGEDVEWELVQALKDKPTPEAARRLQELLTALRNAPPPPDRRRELRAVWAVELIGTPAANKVLMELAKGHSDARLTREARAAIERRRAP
jgi:WD40 repeat protein